MAPEPHRREPVMTQVTTYVGVDAHKKDLFIAMLVGDGQTPVTWTVPNEPNAVKRLVRKLERDAPGPVRMCYEAGPCGYALQRQVATARVSCQVIAPGLIHGSPATASRPIVAMRGNWRSSFGRGC